MIFEALFLAFTLGSESAEKSTAALKASRMLNDTETMRKNFFHEQRRLQQDKFTLFGAVGTTSGKDHQWREATEILDRLEAGYFPYSWTFHYPITDEDLIKCKLENFDYKIVPQDNGEYAELFLKLSDIEDYIAYRNSNGRYFMRSMYEEIPQEIRSLLYDGKITIGVPFGQDGYIPCQIMTFQQAREFMNNKMEERFQKQR